MICYVFHYYVYLFVILSQALCLLIWPKQKLLLFVILCMYVCIRCDAYKILNWIMKYKPHTLVLVLLQCWYGKLTIGKVSHQTCPRVLFWIFLCCWFQGKKQTFECRSYHLLQRVKWAVVISFRSSFVDVCEILHFNLLPRNYWVNWYQSWQECSLQCQIL